MTSNFPCGWSCDQTTIGLWIGDNTDHRWEPVVMKRPRKCITNQTHPLRPMGKCRGYLHTRTAQKSKRQTHSARRRCHHHRCHHRVLCSSITDRRRCPPERRHHSDCGEVIRHGNNTMAVIPHYYIGNNLYLISVNTSIKFTSFQIINQQMKFIITPK